MSQDMNVAVVGQLMLCICVHTPSALQLATMCLLPSDNCCAGHIFAGRCNGALPGLQELLQFMLSDMHCSTPVWTKGLHSFF